MKMQRLLFITLLFMLAACSPAPPPTAAPPPATAPARTPTPAAAGTPDPRYYTAPDGTFALIPPERWEPHELGFEYPALVGPSLGISSANLLFVQEEAAFPVELYAAAVQEKLLAALPELEPISEEYLITDDGHIYFRWEIAHTQNDRDIRQVVYVYGPGDWKLMITYTRPQDYGAENDRLVEAAMQTVRFSR